MIKFIFFLLCFFVECEAEPVSFTKEQVVDLVKAELSQKITSHEFEISLDNWLEAWGKTNATTGSPQLSLNNITVTADQRRFSAVLNINDNQARKLSGKVELLIEIPTLRSPITSNLTITEADIVWQKFPADKLTPWLITKKEDLIGKTSKHAVLKIGTPLHFNEIQSPVVVKKGDTVHVTYKSSTLEMTTKALAKSNGSVGDTIFFEPLIQNHNESLTSKKTIQAKVIGPNMAEIARFS